MEPNHLKNVYDDQICIPRNLRMLFLFNSLIQLVILNANIGATYGSGQEMSRTTSNMIEDANKERR